MKMKSALVAGLLALSACTKTEKIVETRQADPNVRESFVQSNRKTLSIKTSALGKVFMLVANSKTTGQQPAWIEHPIKLVTFEKAGAQVGLFEVGYSQIYSSLASQKILQTFDIVSETSDQVVFNIEKGFTTLNSSQGLETMRPDENQNSLRQQGVEASARIKDLFVKSAIVQDDSLHITQFSRVQRSVLTSRTLRQNKQDTKTPVMMDTESSMDSRIDIFPYVENANFKPKEQDPDWTIGSFVSRILKEESAQEETLANRWDTTKPIRYIITGNTPKEAIPYMKEGLEYWNRVAGRTIVQVEVSDQQDVEPGNGAVIVRWIPWKDAGFAYAGMQQNPITGEIIRGQIYMTSSWLSPSNMGDSIQSNDLVVGNNACGINVSSANEVATLAASVSKGTQKAIFDYLRLVVAHEAGHTLGMRHHFAGASQIKATYDEINQATATYSKDPSQAVQYPEFSVSVMDYTLPLDSAIIGNSLMYRVLSYDKDFVNWSYNGEEKPSSPAGEFCTDDHLMYGGEEGVSIYGCGPFKNVGSPVMAQLKSVQQNDESTIIMDGKAVLAASITADGKFKAPDVSQYYRGIGAYMLGMRPAALSNLLFSVRNQKNSQELNTLMLPKEVTPILLKRQGASNYTSNAVMAKISEEIKQIAENPSTLQLLLPENKDGSLDVKWAQTLFEKIDPKIYREGKTSSGIDYKLNDEELAQFQAAVKETLRYVQRAKLIQSAMRLLISKSSLKNSYINGKDIAEADLQIIYRDWFFNSKIPGMLKPYVEQLLLQDLGNRKIAEVNGSPVYGKLYVMDMTSFEALQSSLKESSLVLNIDLNPVVAKRLQDIKAVLAPFAVNLDGQATVDAQLQAIDAAMLSGQLDFYLGSWAKSELMLNKSMLSQPTL